jgi:ABC-type polysaccharide/polyol phosphate transport system ATPase subunit
MQPVISLRGVSVRYRRSGTLFRRRSYFTALSGIDLDIFPGETLGVLGRNGAGKSTLLQVLSGVIHPDAGTLTNRAGSVALLALQAGVDANLSGRDNAVLNGILQGYPRKYVESRLEEIQAYSELGDFFYEPVRIYSSGMRARLGFAVSTILTPDVLLIDEVLGVGDSQFRKKAEKTIVAKTLSQQTVVLVSHAHQQVARLCDRAVFIDGGRIRATGDPFEVVRQYEEWLASSHTEEQAE